MQPSFGLSELAAADGRGHRRKKFEATKWWVPIGSRHGYGGLLGWFWIACAVTTVALAAAAMAAPRERQYAAVMAATGLLYLAILTGFGTDLVARLPRAG